MPPAPTADSTNTRIGTAPTRRRRKSRPSTKPTGIALDVDGRWKHHLKEGEAEMNDKFIDAISRKLAKRFMDEHNTISPVEYVIVIMKGKTLTTTHRHIPSSPKGRSEITETKFVPDENGQLFGIKLACSFYKNKKGKRTKQMVCSGIKDALMNYIGGFSTDIQDKVEKWIVLT
jgi:hypothetical protein